MDANQNEHVLQHVPASSPMQMVRGHRVHPRRLDHCCP